MGTVRNLGAHEVIVGDLLDPADADRPVGEVDAVLSTVGTTAKYVWTATEFVDGDGNINLVHGAKRADADRCRDGILTRCR